MGGLTPLTRGVRPRGASKRDVATRAANPPHAASYVTTVLPNILREITPPPSLSLSRIVHWKERKGGPDMLCACAWRACASLMARLFFFSALGSAFPLSIFRYFYRAHNASVSVRRRVVCARKCFGCACSVSITRASTCPRCTSGTGRARSSWRHLRGRRACFAAWPAPRQQG